MNEHDPNDPDLTGQDWPHPPDVPASPPPGEEPDETLDPPYPEGYLSGGYAQGIVQAFGEPAPLDIDEIRRRYDERAAQARHRARTRQLQDIQNTALAILIPLIGFISAVLLAGIARLVWLL